ncbi:MAG: hypothetical protein JWM31_952, partial [Solirubrobacterales bacterium]|nr:hypothetical protein [Solirubrobacterales bacterium]
QLPCHAGRSSTRVGRLNRALAPLGLKTFEILREAIDGLKQSRRRRSLMRLLVTPLTQRGKDPLHASYTLRLALPLLGLCTGGLDPGHGWCGAPSRGTHAPEGRCAVPAEGRGREERRWPNVGADRLVHRTPPRPGPCERDAVGRPHTVLAVLVALGARVSGHGVQSLGTRLTDVAAQTRALPAVRAGHLGSESLASRALSSPGRALQTALDAGWSTSGRPAAFALATQ